MGTIEHRGKNSWRISVRTKTATGAWTWTRQTLHMDPSLSLAIQRRDAERELALLEKRLASEASTAYTVRQWSAIWLEQHVALDASPVTVSNYRYLLDSRILPLLGEKLLTELTPALLTDWLLQIRKSPRRSTRLPDDQLIRPRRQAEQQRLAKPAAAAKPLSVRTVRHYHDCMSTMLSVAVRLGYIEHNPMDRVQRPKERKKAPVFLTEEQAVALISLVLQLPPEQQPLKLSVLLALTCGLRLGEVAALRYMAFDKAAGTITVSQALKYTPATGSFISDPKTAAGARTIALPPILTQLLADAWMDDVELSMLDDKWQGAWWIVHGPHGRQVNKDTPSKWFRAFADANGFRGVTFHDLRHAHASILVAHNLDIAAIAARMGHENASTTLGIYTHPFAAQDHAAAAAMSAVLTQAGLPDPAAPAEDPAVDPAAPAAPTT